MFRERGLLARRLMRARVEPRGFELVACFRKQVTDLVRDCNRAVRQQSVHVEHPEANRLEVKGGDRALERLELVDERTNEIILQSPRTEETDESPNMPPSGLSMIAVGHTRLQIADCGFLIADGRLHWRVSIVDCKGQVGNSYVLTWIMALPLARAVTGAADRAGHSVADPWLAPHAPW
jgi:hypothetical protein